MKLILIHGRAQEKFEAVALKKLWLDAFKAGLSRSQLILPKDLEIEFPYYGKLLEKLIKEFEHQRKKGREKNGHQWTLAEHHEIDFSALYYGEIISQLDLSTTEKMSLYGGESNERGPLNWELVQKLLVLMDEKRVFGDSIIKNVTKDVFLYLSNDKIKQTIHEHILKSFDDTEPCVVVGHSLGSVIGYSILKNNPHYQVKKMITVGSPLGVTAVRKFLDNPVEMPKCIQNGWFNAFDTRDFVALNPLDWAHFNTIPAIENFDNVKNHTKNRHDIEGYLDDPLVAKTIYDALTMV